MGSLRDVSREFLLVCCTDLINKSDIPIFLGSSTNNHCFADILLFMFYTSFDQLSSRLTAEEGLTFYISGKGTVKIQTNVNGERRTITFDNALYIPRFRSNLISMTKLSIKGAEAQFRDNKAIIKIKTGIDIISATCSGLLYVVKMDKIQLISFTAQSKQKPTSFAT